MATKEFVRSWEAGTRPDRQPVDVDRLLAAIEQPLRQRRGPYSLKTERGDTSWSTERNVRETLERLERLLPKLPVGEMVRVKARDGILRIYSVEDRDIALPSGADRWHPLLREAYQEIWSDEELRGHIRYGGAEVCRPTRHDPNVWSMHSYWPPALALDVFVDSKKTGDRVAAIMRRVGLQVVWWTTAHYDHVHGQAGDSRSGTPACA